MASSTRTTSRSCRSPTPTPRPPRRCPLHHRDPFDRMLIAQAQIEDAVLLTADPAMAAYDVRTAW